MFPLFKGFNEGDNEGDEVLAWAWEEKESSGSGGGGGGVVFFARSDKSEMLTSRICCQFISFSHVLLLV